jgi:hypothetical protein
VKTIWVISDWLKRWNTPAGYWRRHGNKETMETGEVLFVPGRNSWRKIGPITEDTGKGAKANRMAEWPVVVKKESNVSGAKGPC